MRGMRLILATGLVCAAAAAQARDWPVYLGASYGVAAVDGTADANGISDTDSPPQSIPIDGLPFEDDDGAWSAFLGYELFNFMALEAGYADFGTLDSDLVSFGGSEMPSIDIQSAHLTLRFRASVTDSISATWHAGVTRSEFDVSGALRPIVIIPNPPFPLPPGGPLRPIPGTPFIPTAPPELPFERPKDETGFRWGFGVDWQFLRHLSAGLEFSREDVRVLTLDTYKLRLTAHL